MNQCVFCWLIQKFKREYSNRRNKHDNNIWRIMNNRPSNQQTILTLTRLMRFDINIMNHHDIFASSCSIFSLSFFSFAIFSCCWAA